MISHLKEDVPAQYAHSLELDFPSQLNDRPSAANINPFAVPAEIPDCVNPSNLITSAAEASQHELLEEGKKLDGGRTHFSQF